MDRIYLYRLIFKNVWVNNRPSSPGKGKNTFEAFILWNWFLGRNHVRKERSLLLLVPGFQYGDDSLKPVLDRVFGRLLPSSLNPETSVGTFDHW